MGNTKTRDVTIDIMRGLCIILVVCGHCRAPFADFIYLFHMAVFFMISGYFWNEKNADSFKSAVDYIKKKLKTLWLPFAGCSAAFTLFNNLFIKLGIYTADEAFLEVSGGGITPLQAT